MYIYNYQHGLILTWVNMDSQLVSYDFTINSLSMTNEDNKNSIVSLS